MEKKPLDTRYLVVLSIAALGVVYGDIGTSPLYSLRECFMGPHAVLVTRENVFGVLSLIFWSLIGIVSIKYLCFVLRADNHGEGGILALLSLTFPENRETKQGKVATLMVALGLFGTALLYGDGMITPAISVLSAVEGLNVATPVFDPYIIPITILILVSLFSVQHHGTGKVGKIFGRVTLVWFIVIAILGVRGILFSPDVLLAVNPYHALKFFMLNGWQGFIVLGSVFLVVTGGEALYADMGHFGRSPIRWAWFSLVLPTLLLNYFGQGALLLTKPEAAENPFFHLAPSWGIYPLVGLSTAATIIASQALISGAFSLTMQAVQLGYFPRLRIQHTSSTEKGQIYIPQVNWALMVACVGLVLGFRSSSNLAAAYGIAVTMTMLVTTVLFYFAAKDLWKWGREKALLVCLPFLLIEIAYFGANALKFTHGGWFPILVGAVIFVLLTTWKRGRKILGKRLQAATIPYDEFVQNVQTFPPTRVRGTAIFLSGRKDVTPLSLLHNLKHNKVLHERVVFLTIITRDAPYHSDSNRIEVEDLKNGFYRVIGHYGYMEEPDVPELLGRCEKFKLKISPLETTYFVSKETLILSSRYEMALWRGRLFSLMSKNAMSASAFFKLPPNRVVELGMQVEL